MDPSLVFPVPEDGSEELEYFIAGPEMSGNVQPIWPGFYIRYMPQTEEWVWTEFVDGYWAVPDSIFMHEEQNAIWKGAILKATQQMVDEITQLRSQLK